MSHMVTITTRVRDLHALSAACRRLGLSPPVEGTARLYAESASGHIVQLPGWRYPLVVDLGSGTVRFDHYNGAWGEPALLDRLLQAYAIEKVAQGARRKGQTCLEQALPDGSVRLIIQAGGGA